MCEREEEEKSRAACEVPLSLDLDGGLLTKFSKLMDHNYSIPQKHALTHLTRSSQSTRRACCT